VKERHIKILINWYSSDEIEKQKEQLQADESCRIIAR
jgi:hypothetical protein